MLKINYKNIRTVEDIRRKKKIINKHARIRERIIVKRFRKLESVATPVYFYEQFVKEIKMEDTVLSLLPYLAKLIEPVKGFLLSKGNFKKIFPILGGVGAGLTALLAIFKLKRTKNSSSETQDENLFI